MRISISLCALALAGCSSNAKHFPQRPCAESKQMRADGEYRTYDGPPQRPWDTYHVSCQKECLGESNGASCAEYDALSDMFSTTYTPDPEPAPYSGSSTSSSSAVETAVANATSVAEESGYRLASDTSWSLADDGFASFEVITQPSLTYMFVLIADLGTTFTASIGGGGCDGSQALERQDSVQSVFVLATGFSTACTTGSPWVSITSDGGDRGTVRALRFEKWQ
jgi:hypothetical protein